MVGARLLLGPLADASNTSLMEGSACSQGALILASEPPKPLPGPKPRLTPKPFAVDKNPTIRPILAPKPQPRPRPDAGRQPPSLKPDPPSTPKSALVGSVASKPRPAPTSTSTTAVRPASGFSTKPGQKPSTGQTSKPVAQPFKPAPAFVSAESRKPSGSQWAKKPVVAGPAVPQKKPGGAVQAPRSSAEWSGSTQRKSLGSTMTRAKSLGFLTEVGLNEEGQRDGTSGAEDRGPGATVVTASAPVPLRPHGRGGRPRPVSAIFLPSSAAADAQGSSSTAGDAGPRWTGRRPLSADLTSKFETAGFSVHQKPARTGSVENIAEQARAERQDEGEGEGEQSRTGGVTGGREKEKERGSGDGKEDKSKAAAQEREGEGKQEVGEGQEEVRGGGSIKRRISLLLDSSSSAVLTVPAACRTSADGVEARSAAQPIPDVDKAIGVKQRIRELSEDSPLSQSPPQKPVVKPRPLPRDLTKR